MCGIAVAVGHPDADLVVRGLAARILHRGDVTDPLTSPAPGIAMCTRRLRIVDGDRAVQPQASFDGRFLVSFNGEIYNHHELRRELTQLGIPFKTQSDTEVLANALRAWGYHALNRLVGMFAFVAVDLSTGEFLAARDPFGVKPLYVVQDAPGFVFCSEIAPLLTVIEDGDVLLLPPGYLLTRNACVKYHRPTAVSPLVPSDSKTLDRILSEAVRIRIPDDLKFATLLSGGIDSTLVAHYAKRFSTAAPGYFLGGTGSVDYPYAAAFAEKSGLDLRLVPFDCEDDATFTMTGDVVTSLESFEPGDVRGALCSSALAKRMNADGFRVSLCGDGADEMFCGYPAIADVFSENSALGLQMRDECVSLMHRTCLQRVDRASMRFQLETREPFLDPRVAGYALGLDESSLVDCSSGSPVGKIALRRIYDLYPSELPTLIRDRRKVPLYQSTGLDSDRPDSSWVARFESAISDTELRNGQKEFADFDIATKEELYYLRALSDAMDVSRVPHLRDRVRVTVPERPQQQLKACA
jgi:asparagine synthase (glutamine-hydrolysing)